MIAPATTRAVPVVSPGASPGAEAIRRALVARVRLSEASLVLQNLARGLACVVAPVLVWARDHAGVSLTPAQVSRSLQLDAIAALVERRVFFVAGPARDATDEIPVPGMPEEMVARLRAYLQRTPCYDPGLPYAGQDVEWAREIHSFATSPLDPSGAAAAAGGRP